MSTLLDISDDIRAIDALLDEVEGDISDPKVAEAIDAWMAEAETNMRTKVDNYAAFITELLGRAKVREEEAKRMAARARVDKAAAASLKGRLLFFFETHGLKKLETDRYKVGVANNGGKQPVQVDLLPELLPKDLQRVTVAADTDEIRAKLAAGEKVEGCYLVPRGTHLRIA